MNLRRARVGLILGLGLLSGCGQTLDLGSNPRAGCEKTPAEPRKLSALSEFPDFTPSTLVVVGDAAYVGGVSYPGRQFDANAKDIGRVIRFPLDGSPPKEIWKGTFFRAPIRVYGSRIAFLETDFVNVLTFPTFGGIHVYDTKTAKHTMVPNLPGRDFVTDFELGAEGFVFSSGSFARSIPDGTVLGKPGSSIGRLSETDSAPRSILELTKRSARFFRRGDHVLAQLVADNSESGYDEPESAGTVQAVFAISETGLRMEQKFDSFMRPETAAQQNITTTFVGADETSYYFTIRMFAETAPYRVPRTKAPVNIQENIASTLWGQPLFDGGELYWTPLADRSMIRRRVLEGDSAEAKAGVEVSFDPRRQVSAFGVDACQVVWMSESFVDRETYRVMVGPRK